MKRSVNARFVIVAVCAIAFAACHKNNTVPDKYYISELTRAVHKWSGGYSYDDQKPPEVSYSTTYNDTSFAVQKADDSTINFLGISMRYMQTDTANGAVIYQKISSNFPVSLHYYYAADSMFFISDNTQVDGEYPIFITTTWRTHK